MNSKTCPPEWLPEQVNTGVWLSHYTVDELEQRLAHEHIVLPICSWDTPIEELERLGPLLLPPLYLEALDADLTRPLLARIDGCFPYFKGSQRRAAVKATLKVVELSRPASRPPDSRARILAFSVDTAVEEHGPHLPLATDRIQSYAVLAKLAEETEGLALAPPVDYGHLTWGLPRGLSIDITTALLSRYVANYARSLVARYQAEALYVVDVHGSPVHRLAIQERPRGQRSRTLEIPLAARAAGRVCVRARGPACRRSRDGRDRGDRTRPARPTLVARPDQ